MSLMTEIRWHGRGGQGGVTAGGLMAEVAMEEGKFFQSFPEYGAERMGAPIKSYTRISDEPIEFHCPILEPEMIIVVNPNLVGAVNLTEGLDPDGTVIINTTDSPAVVRERLDLQGGKVWCIDASKIAREELKRDIPSTMMLAVVARATGIIDLDVAKTAVRQTLGERLRPQVVEANVRALQRAYDECVEG